ncbi:glycerophosphodiester phosphodiesterase [Streptomyces sp. ISL-43]|uniref:glycerophosphodiester phosphodiesterase n=1 Tax=Streptomyces sp. ISL-43 TaxID=2819183 RepID=UPI001BE9D84B|nr:glycerophosphodiester phosphodiesterase family protein [Streptomyces sp. ISL-43]MBT2451841.1 glycerophosphodiester phosphodiesterase [Streptomyces sp. ISL-43]
MTFLTIGHRGVMGVEPENTLRSFVRAERSGMDVLALDLRLSKDGALVVLHDADVDRTTDGSGAVADLTLAELRGLDAGDGQQVPLLEEVLDAVRAPLRVQVHELSAVRPFAELLLRRDLTGRVEVASFVDEVLVEAAGLVPGLRTVLYVNQGTADAGAAIGRAVAAGAETIALNIQHLTPHTVEAAHEAGLRVTGWTVNSLERLRLARALELDGVLTDFPEIRSTGRFTA